MKRKLMLCTMLLLLCSMLINSTFALNATSSQYETATIQSGSLNAELYWSTDLKTWEDAENSQETSSNNPPIFGGDFWEPGHTQVRYFKIVNDNSTTGFNYQLKLYWGEDGNKKEIDPSSYPINHEIDIYRLVSPTAPLNSREDVYNMEPLGTLAKNQILMSGTLTASEKEQIVAIAFRMKESASDDLKGASSGKFSIILGVQNNTENS